MSELNTDFIREFWNAQAEKHGTAHAASWEDNFAISLEIETIGPHIKAGNAVLDVGCANGYSVLHHLQRKPLSITGVDYSESMIREAEKNKARLGSADHVTFRVGDVRKLPLQDALFDVVYTTRTLINLPNWQQQQQAIRECLRVCKPGGTAIFSEAFWEPLTLLNAMRALRSLPPLAEHDYNRYLKKSNLEQFLAEQKLSFEVVDFSSIYYLGSRFLRELVTNPGDYPGYSNPINEVFYNIEKQFSGGGFGIQQAYIVRKK